MMKIFKILFSIVFLVVAILWILYTISYFGYFTEGWEGLQNIKPIAELNNTISRWLNENIHNSGTKSLGFKLLLIGGSVLFLYTAIAFPIKMIPFIGTIFKYITFIIPGLSVLMIIGGLILMFANINLNLPEIHIPGIQSLVSI